MAPSWIRSLSQSTIEKLLFDTTQSRISLFECGENEKAVISAVMQDRNLTNTVEIHSKCKNRVGLCFVMRVTAFLALALCAAVAAAQSSVPQQIHYAFAGRDDATGVSNGASISWATPIATSTSTVWYGTAPGALTRTATGTSITYLEVRVHRDASASGTGAYRAIGKDCDAAESPRAVFRLVFLYELR